MQVLKNHFSKDNNLVTLCPGQYFRSMFALGHICINTQEKKEGARKMRKP